MVRKIHEATITIKLPKKLKEDLNRKLADANSRSNIIRGLIQMFVQGKIKSVVYQEEKQFM